MGLLNKNNMRNKIKIYMYDERKAKHHTPHIHIIYQDMEAVVNYKTGELIEGKWNKIIKRYVLS